MHGELPVDSGRKDIFLKFPGEQMGKGAQISGILFLKGVRAVFTAPLPVNVAQISQGQLVSEGIKDLLHKRRAGGKGLKKQFVRTDGVPEILLNPVLAA